MTKVAALHSFFSNFGINAYEETAIYDLTPAPDFPYLTYEITTDSFSESKTPLNISLWYRSGSWVDANAKAEEISAEIGEGGKIINCDSGNIWITRGSPFAQRMGDDTDSKIKRIIISLSVEFWTEN
jgi:hypothetical protein